MKPLRHFLLACGAAASLCAQTELPPAPEIEVPPAPPEEPRDAAKREAWTSAVLIFSLLEQGSNAEFPGIRAWLDDFRHVAATTPLPEFGQPFPPVDTDALVTHNPHFWSAFYEVQPGDPGLALLHAALLLSGGEAQRAAAIATFGLQRTGPEEIRRGLRSIVAHCTMAQARSMELVQLGVRLHDMGEYETAVKQFDAAIREWPANGSAHCERGSSLRMQLMAAARKTAKPDDEPVPDSAETLASFARCRLHDPFYLLAYQGADAQLKTALLALVNDGVPVWETIRRKPEQPVRTNALREFSEACATASIDEFALVLRQLVVAGNRHYAEPDAELITASLTRLAPAALTPDLLARVSGEIRLAARQLVVPAPVAPPEVAQEEEPEAKPKKKPMAKGGKSGSKNVMSSSSKKKKRTAGSGGSSKAKGKSGKKKRS